MILCLGPALLSLALAAPAGSSEQDLLSMEPGESRARALTEGLPGLAPEELQAHLVVAFEEFMDQNRAFRLELSLPLAEAMHARAGATWSAMSLALVSTRAGESARARAVLEQQLRRTPEGVERYELLERLGLAILGSGDQRGALGPLGSAFARGSANAGVVLGRLDLAAGRHGRARALFRSLLEEDPPQSWALRGWGLSMLARGNSSPSRF